jgi:hypothetical protein
MATLEKRHVSGSLRHQAPELDTGEKTPAASRVIFVAAVGSHSVYVLRDTFHGCGLAEAAMTILGLTLNQNHTDSLILPVVDIERKLRSCDIKVRVRDRLALPEQSWDEHGIRPTYWVTSWAKFGNGECRRMLS